MNYIKKLEQKVRARGAMVAAMENEINDMRRYLTSDKFRVDPTVQVQDVLNRLANVTYAAVDAADEEA